MNEVDKTIAKQAVPTTKKGAMNGVLFMAGGQ
jgi:hypothetical protein